MFFTENRETLICHLAGFYEQAVDSMKKDPSITNPSYLARLYVENEISMEKGMDEYYQGVIEVNRRNARLLRAIKSVKGNTFYKYLLEILSDDGPVDWTPMEIVSKPTGIFQEEKYGRQIKGIWVDQRSVGDSGDSFEGTICVQLKENKYLKFHFSC